MRLDVVPTVELLLERARIFATDSLFVKPFPCYIADVTLFFVFAISLGIYLRLFWR